MALLLRAERLWDFPAAPGGNAILVEEDRIARVGDFRELRRERPDASVVDLAGHLLLPGLTDTHTHFFELARRRAGVDLSGARSLDEVRARLLAHRERGAEDDGWVGGSGWDPGRYGDDPGMGHELLDGIFPDRPVALESRDFHTLWCNRRALEEAGVMSGAQAPPGGEIGRRADGSPDGFLYETAWSLILDARPAERRDRAEAWVLDTMRYAHSLGLTGVHSLEPLGSWEIYRRLREADRLRLRVCYHSPVDALEGRIQSGPASYVEHDPWLRRGGVKIFMDGSLGSRTACMRTPYPDGGVGRQLLEREELEDRLRRAAGAGIAGTVHAIGDRALEVVLEAFERLAAGGIGTGLLHRIEHAQCVPDDLLPRLARLGLYCAVQPVHLVDDVALLPRLWPEASRFAYPLRSMRAAGVPMGLGSDAPVATLDPRQGWLAAVRRRSGNRPEGACWTPEQALTLDEAVAGYTCWAAAGSGREAELGTLRPGKLADLVALEDPREDEVEAWAEAPVGLTLVGGEIVYDAR